MKNPLGLFGMGRDAQKKIIAQAQKDLADNAHRAARLVTAGFDPAGTGDFILVGSESELSLTHVAIRLNQVQLLGLLGQAATGMASMLMQQQAALRKMGEEAKRRD